MDKDVFIIQVVNKFRQIGYMCDTKEGMGFTSTLCKETKYFYSWLDAKRTANKLKGFKQVTVLKAKNIINDKELSKELGFKTTKEVGEVCLIVGYTDDGVKHWIHYDAKEEKYYPRSQKIGACAWQRHQTDDVIKFLEADKTISINKYEIEKLEDLKPEENQISKSV